jgi:hypothetical protein
MDARPNNSEQLASHPSTGFVRVRGAREHNLKNVALDIPRNCPGGVYRYFRIRKVLFGFWNAVCGSPTALPRVGLSLCAQTVPSNGGT